MLVSFFDLWTIFGLLLIGFGFIIISLKVIINLLNLLSMMMG